MPTMLAGKISWLGPARREKVEARAAELFAEKMSLRDLRDALRLTQERLAEFLRMGRESVSRLERRSDLLLSTLRGDVEAMSGRLSLVAEFPNRWPVVLAGIAGVGGGRATPGHQKASVPRVARVRRQR